MQPGTCARVPREWPCDRPRSRAACAQIAHLACCDGRELCFADGRYERTVPASIAEAAPRVHTCGKYPIEVERAVQHALARKTAFPKPRATHPSTAAHPAVAACMAGDSREARLRRRDRRKV